MRPAYTNSRQIYQELAKGNLGTVEALHALRLLQANGSVSTLPASAGDPTGKPNNALEELNKLIGLEAVKKLVEEIQAFVQIRRYRQEYGLKAEPLVLHMIFKGNPGTGKTTVARILGALFKELGVLSKGHLIEVERADLVGEYIGHTAQRTREQVKKALGGILFIDEAYSLARGGEKDFGKEAIDTLVKAMEDHKDELILILAGYRREMEKFVQSNPGLSSRFPIILEFPDYNLTELMEIAKLMVKEREYRLSEAAEKCLYNLLKNQVDNYDENRGNARLVRNLVERSIRRQAVRLTRAGQFDRNSLTVLTEADILAAAEGAE
ncbi:MAG: AAA family ATPase [Firmicutes bacterium]|nr:AAA family ATPase [Bacillota bacterium]